MFARPLFTLVAGSVWLAELVVTSSTGLTTVIGLALGAAIQQNAFARLVPTFEHVEP
jgi:hypothetical protein